MNGYCKLLTLAVVTLAVAAAPVWAGSIEGKVMCGAICGNLVIYVEGVPGEWSGVGEVAILDQVKKTYVPHVQAILPGTAVRLKNSDPELHNVHAYRGKETVFNVAMVPGLSFDMKRFKEPGTYVVLCDIHTEMSAYIVVLDNPFFTQPDGSGSWAIHDLPPGTYNLVKYDPEERERVERQVVVGEGSVEVAF